MRIVAIALALLLASGCGDPKTIDGKLYDTYGVFNANENKNAGIKYEPSWGNVFWGIVLVETIIVPIYCFGFDLMEPVGLATGEPGVMP